MGHSQRDAINFMKENSNLSDDWLIQSDSTSHLLIDRQNKIAYIVYNPGVTGKYFDFETVDNYDEALEKFQEDIPG